MGQINAHILVKNEENFIWFAIRSVIDYVDQMLIYDTGSQDKTVEIIKTIISPKINFEEKGPVNLEQYIRLRQELIDRTKTDWFLQLDGDEVWPEDSIKSLIRLINKASDNVVGIVNRTRNCVGDIYHFLPEEAGDYQLLGRKGHLNIRAVRKTADLKVKLAPPFNTYTETYINAKGPIPEQDGNLLFLDKYLWHMTHLCRSRFDDHGKGKLELGIPFPPQTQYPEVFNLQRPMMVADPWIEIKACDWVKSVLQTPLKKLKRKLTKDEIKR